MLRILGQLLDRQLARCLLCGEGDGVLNGICAPCSNDLPALGHSCQTCALPLPNTGDRHCASCQQQPPPQSLSRACWYYAYPVAQLIQRFKYQRDLAAGHTLAELAAVVLDPAPAQHPDLLVPIPMHWRKQLARGYNQAQLIATTLGSRWRIPVEPRALRKLTPTDSQQTLRRTQRKKNLARSFRARADRVAGLHIGLVDDVITTGATLEAAAQALLDAGAHQVSAIALARTP